ncbi:MAG: lipoprotein-releasing ABC transporter permease subunit [Gammaproteobacteria bacterium]|nr:lipoprotein-releasing ABC transporter permease subunit [Gammaproteobacteria bacterium]MDP2141364.1 lipoprotein-releasing ABC transporter permease subunit [Gammaproteobacteria bacterium]MDP2349049.1 lipoprotein-releasing ABC transporter permease subunit [Gammaproteobacteria bacterium]
MAADASGTSVIGATASSSFAAWIALRYVSVGRRSQLVSFMSMLTISGLALGIAILITVLSVMNGFDREVRENILGILPHATIKAQERQPLQRWQVIQQGLDAHPAVLASAPLIEETGVLAVPGYAKGVVVNGIDPEQEARISILERFMLSGSLSGLSEQRFNIVLGATLAENLGVAVGDKVSLYSLNISINPLAPLPTQRQFTVAGIYRVGTLELDSAMAMITLQDAQALYRYRDSYSDLRFRIDDLFAVRQIRLDLLNELPPGFEVQTWTQLFGNIYENIQFSRTIVGFLLWLLVGVAAFNLVVSLIMIVRDKRGDIAILRTLGASPQTIGRIFMTQGCIVGLIGTVIGITVGVFFSLTIGDIAAFIEQALGMKLLSAEVYPVDFLPSQLRLTDIVGVSIGVFLLSVLATLYPAYRAARVQPAEALRFE